MESGPDGVSAAQVDVVSRLRQPQVPATQDRYLPRLYDRAHFPGAGAPPARTSGSAVIALERSGSWPGTDRPRGISHRIAPTRVTSAASASNVYCDETVHESGAGCSKRERPIQ